jgi:hypothetical protein
LWQIFLQKFFGVERKVLEPPMRLARGVDPKSTKGLRGSAEKATQQQSGLKINAREIFRVV